VAALVRATLAVAAGLRIAEVIYLRIDIVLLERLRGVEETGIYAVAARLSEVWYMVPVALMGAVFPALWQRRQDAVGTSADCRHRSTCCARWPLRSRS